MAFTSCSRKNWTALSCRTIFSGIGLTPPGLRPWPPTSYARTVQALSAPERQAEPPRVPAFAVEAAGGPACSIVRGRHLLSQRFAPWTNPCPPQQPGVIDHQAAVHDHGDAGRGCPARPRLVDAVELEPECGSAGSQGVVDDRMQVLASPEHVHQIERSLDVLDAAIDLPPEDLLLAGIHRDHVVAPLEEVAGHAVGVAVRLRGKAHDRDPPRVLQEVAEALVVGIAERFRHPGVGGHSRKMLARSRAQSLAVGEAERQALGASLRCASGRHRLASTHRSYARASIACTHRVPSRMGWNHQAAPQGLGWTGRSARGAASGMLALP